MTVVVPAFNAHRFLDQCIGSVLGQTRHDWRLVIVDDGSSDSTAEIVRRAAAADDRIALLQQTNSGAATARNAGAMAAQSAYLLFLDADDMLEPDALADLLEAVDACEGVGVYGNARYVDGGGAPVAVGELEYWTRARLDGEEALTAQRLIGGPCVMTPGQMLVRRSAHDAVGGFERRLRMAEDWDYALRLAELGPLEFVDEVVMSYRRHGQNTSVLHSSISRRCIQAVRLRVVHRAGRQGRRRVLAEHRRFYWGMTKYHARAGSWREAARAAPLWAVYTPPLWRPYRAAVARWIGPPMASALR